MIALKELAQALLAADAVEAEIRGIDVLDDGIELFVTIPTSGQRTLGAAMDAEGKVLAELRHLQDISQLRGILRRHGLNLDAAALLDGAMKGQVG